MVHGVAKSRTGLKRRSSSSDGDADKEDRLTDRGGGEGEGGMDGESSMETYTLPYVKQTANGNLLYDSRNSKQNSVTT